MGANDGYVIGLKKLVDHGPATVRWNVVIVSEGYQAAEIPKFHQDASTFVDRLFQTKPFDEMWCAINLYRLDVVSTDSGADDPAGGSCTGTGKMANTYFDATFCSQGIPRLLTIDDSLAESTVFAQLPQYNLIVVIVNSTIYGGGGAAPGGPPVAVYSLGVSPISGKGKEDAGIHEMGHSGFGLADEYPYGGGDTYSGIEPVEPDVTANSNKATIKWKDLISAQTNVPTTTNQNCSVEDPQASPVPPRHSRRVRRGAILSLRAVPARVQLPDERAGESILRGLRQNDQRHASAIHFTDHGYPAFQQHQFPGHPGRDWWSRGNHISCGGI